MIYAYPTDTLWGLGAELSDPAGNRLIRELKGNPPDKPLSVLAPDLTSLRELVNLPEHLSDSWLVDFFALESALALPRERLRRPLPPWVCGASEFVSFRCLPVFDIPLTSTSVNRSGEAAAATEEEVKAFLGDVPHRLLPPPPGVTPSGTGSTMVALAEDGSFSFWREGKRAGSIRRLLGSR